MSTQRDVWTDHRLVPPIEFDRLLADDPWMPPVYIAPSDCPGQLCELGSGDEFTRCTREELREWAQSIIDTLGTS